MDLGMKHESMEHTAVEAPKEPKVTYPTVSIEKHLKGYEVGDEFTAQVKFRVMGMSMGKDYPGGQEKERCTLEMISINPQKMKGKGLPHGQY